MILLLLAVVNNASSHSSKQHDWSKKFASVEHGFANHSGALGIFQIEKFLWAGQNSDYEISLIFTSVNLA